MALASLFLAGAAPAVATVLDEVAGAGAVVVVEHLRLARKLASARSVLAVGADATRWKRSAAPAICAASTSLPFADAAVAAAVLVDLGKREDWEAIMNEARRVVASDGAVVLVDRAPAVEVSRRALCGGLLDIRQRLVGRHLLTWGRPSRFDDPGAVAG